MKGFNPREGGGDKEGGITGLTVIGKPASAAGKTDPAAGAVIIKGLNPLRGLIRKVRVIKNRSHSPLVDKNPPLEGVQSTEVVRLTHRRTREVLRIKTAVEKGLYRVDADSVAESMVERFLELFLGGSVDGHGAFVRRKQ